MGSIKVISFFNSTKFFLLGLIEIFSTSDYRYARSRSSISDKQLLMRVSDLSSDNKSEKCIFKKFSSFKITQHDYINLSSTLESRSLNYQVKALTFSFSFLGLQTILKLNLNKYLLYWTCSWLNVLVVIKYTQFL